MSDIKQINGKFYDFGCKNESFLITAKELQTLGIKNYYFMLRIDNPRVADIDPFKPDITAQEITALMQEYRNNMWFFCRTAVRMRTDQGVVPYGLHRGLAAALWCFERHQDFCLNEPRQTWKTTGTIGGPILWSFQLSQNLHVHFFGKETANTKRNLSDLQNNIDLLPEWLQFKRYMDEDGKIKKVRPSTEILRNKLFHNELEIHPKPSSLSHAQGMGRGGSGAILYFDEIEHTPFFGEILSNSAPLFKTASENAAAAGRPYCRIMTTTPGNLDTREGRESYPIIQSMIPWTEKIYDMTDEEIANYKSAFKDSYHNSEEKHTREVIDVFYLEYQYYQVRRTPEWVMEQYGLSGDKMAIRREILLQRLRGSTESPIDPEDIEYLIANMKKSDRDILINGKWRFRIYDHGAGVSYGRMKDLDENIPYLVGIDPAGGGGGDNFSVTIVNPYNLRIAAEFKSPYIGGPDAVRMLVELVTTYIPRAVLIPEKNSMGIYLLQMLLETSIRDNLYWSESERQLEEMTEEDSEDKELKSMAARYKKYGTYTSPKVRKAMFELLFQYVDGAKQVLNTEYLVDDICKLVRTSTGRIEAVKGEHDDCIMSWLHAIYIYHTGDNLHTFGIDKPTEHPLFGAVDPDAEKSLDDAREEANNIDETNKTWDEEVIEDAALVESRIKSQVDSLSFVHDPIYSKTKLEQELYGRDAMVDIPASFFSEFD